MIRPGGKAACVCADALLRRELRADALLRRGLAELRDGRPAVEGLPRFTRRRALRSAEAAAVGAEAAAVGAEVGVA